MAYSEDDVRWAYQYYLARPPENEAAIARHAQTSDIRDLLYRSKERVALGLTGFRPDEYCVWRPGKPKIVVISSCQGPALARVMAAIADVSVYACAVVKTRNAALAQSLLQMMEGADHIIIANLTAVWGQFSRAALQQRFGQKVTVYHRPFFEALHPDLTYGEPDSPKSAVGDYHSRIVVDSFHAGLTEGQCLARFNAAEYRRMGFEAIAAAAIDKLHAKDRDVDIGIADLVLGRMKDVPLFYTVNHPTAALQEQIARRVLAHLGYDTQPTHALLTPTELSYAQIWPVDADWAGIMGLNWQTPQVYWINNYMMSQEEFVLRCYALYRGMRPVRIASPQD